MMILNKSSEAFMQKYYTIGDVSKIMGISTQTLRYYNSIDLLKPAYVNEDTGYRYYSESQFHFIDRIRYLQKLGMSLDEIKKVLIHNDIQSLIDNLSELEKDCQNKIDELNNTLDTIKWYRNYFTHSEEEQSEKIASVQHFPKRYMVAVRINDGESRESYHVKLTTLRNKDSMKNLPYMRQYSIIIDYDKLLEMKLKPLCLGMFIKAMPADSKQSLRPPGSIIEIPEGNYYCFRSRILSEGWNPYLIKMFFSNSTKKPSLVLANEYEDSLTEYHQCPYEVQILIEDEADAKAQQLQL